MGNLPLNILFYRDLYELNLNVIWIAFLEILALSIAMVTKRLAPMLTSSQHQKCEVARSTAQYWEACGVIGIETSRGK